MQEDHENAWKKLFVVAFVAIIVATVSLQVRLKTRCAAKVTKCNAQNQGLRLPQKTPPQYLFLTQCALPGHSTGNAAMSSTGICLPRAAIS